MGISTVNILYMGVEPKIGVVFIFPKKRMVKNNGSKTLFFNG